jgi:hypothetical protein
MGNDDEKQKDESGSSESGPDGNGRVGEVLDPENGLTGVLSRLQKMATQTLADNLGTVVTCVLTSVKKNHLSGAKMLLELAGQVQSENGVSEAEYRSFAEELWKEYEKAVGEVVD